MDAYFTSAFPSDKLPDSSTGFQHAKTQMTGMEQYYEIEKILEIMNRGGLVLLPTDTVWSVGCDATDTDALLRLFNLKKRSVKKSFTILVNSVDMLKRFVPRLHPRLETLLMYHTRPLTVLYEKTENLPPVLEHEAGTFAIRITLDPFCQQLIENFGKPIIASSANVISEPFPTHFGMVSSEIIVGVDYVVRHRQKDKTPASPAVMVRLEEDDPELIVVRE